MHTEQNHSIKNNKCGLNEMPKSDQIKHSETVVNISHKKSKLLPFIMLKWMTVPATLRRIRGTHIM